MERKYIWILKLIYTRGLPKVHVKMLIMKNHAWVSKVLAPKQAFLWITIPHTFLKSPRLHTESRTPESRGTFLWRLLRSCRTVSHDATFPSAGGGASSFPTRSATLSVFPICDGSRPTGYERALPCGFGLHCPSDTWWHWESFHVPGDHVCILGDKQTLWGQIVLTCRR